MVVNAEQWDLIDTNLHSPGAPIRRGPVRRCGEKEGFPSSHCALSKQSHHHHSGPPFSTGQHLAFHLLALDEMPPLSARDERPWQTSNKLAGRLLPGVSSSSLPKHFPAMDRRISHFSRVHGPPPEIQHWYLRPATCAAHN